MRDVVEPSPNGEAADIKRLKELEAENSKLKRMYADLALECNALKDPGIENKDILKITGDLSLVKPR